MWITRIWITCSQSCFLHLIYSFISRSCQHLLHLLKLTLPHPSSSKFILGWITTTFSLLSLPVLSQTSFPLPGCKIVAVPSSWVLNLIKFDGSRSSFCPKRTHTTGSRVFLRLPVSAAVAGLACCLERWRDHQNRTACQRNKAPSERQAQYKNSSLFQEVPPLQVKLHLYIWMYHFPSLSNLPDLGVLLWSSGTLVLQIFWNLSVSGFICPDASMLLTRMLSPISDIGNGAQILRGGQIPHWWKCSYRLCSYTYRNLH